MSRILIVEDDERIRSSMRLALEDEGYTVDDVGSGEEAVARFEAEPSEVVLIDLMLPGMDGFEACRALRRISMRLWLESTKRPPGVVRPSVIRSLIFPLLEYAVTVFIIESEM